MNIGITLTSSLSVGEDYIELTRSVAGILANAGLGIVYGGTDYGMMKELAQAYINAGGKHLTGVMSSELKRVTKGYKAYEGLSTQIWTETIGERVKSIMDTADGFIILPGGYGTLEEASIIIGGKANLLFDKPVLLVNFKGFYDNYIQFIEQMHQKKFSKISLEKMVRVSHSIDGVVDYFLNYKSNVLPDKFV